MPKKSRPRATLLLDGDIAAFKSTLHAEEEVRWCDEKEGELWILSTDLAKAKLHFENYLQSLTEKMGSHDLIIFLTDTENFRKNIYPEYKGNRKGVRKPMGFTPFREWLLEDWHAQIMPALEADDAMGIHATSDWYDFPIIVSDDKDLQQIPGRVLRFGDVIEISEKQGDFYFLQQTLQGDATDNYPGCPGIGEKRATDALLKDPSWETVVRLYEKAELTEADAIVQARVARILRSSDWDHKQQKVKLWHPATG